MTEAAQPFDVEGPGIVFVVCASFGPAYLARLRDDASPPHGKLDLLFRSAFFWIALTPSFICGSQLLSPLCGVSSALIRSSFLFESTWALTAPLVVQPFTFSALPAKPLVNWPKVHAVFWEDFPAFSTLSFHFTFLSPAPALSRGSSSPFLGCQSEQATVSTFCL